MKLTLSQAEIEQAVINYLLSKGLDFGKTIVWDVTWIKIMIPIQPILNVP